ncbi:MAG: NAD-binding protein, partial [Candidatus Omnitrophica bacterium]|nr:NAD-binding protein [Candidatus Omnitrophota bacterium]
PQTSPLVGMQMQDFSAEDFPWPFLIISIVREKEVIIPKGDTVIKADDLIYTLLPASSLAEFLTFVNPESKMPKKVLVYGASITGRHLVAELTNTIKDITVLEEDPVLAKAIAGDFKAIRVINGSASEADILNECGIEVADAFIATSNNDHLNLISSVLAKKMGAKFAIITTQQPDYLSIIDALDIDAIINPHHLAVEQILHLVRGKGITSVAKLLECDAEALEFIPEEGSPITKAKVKDLKFPKESIIGAIYSETGAELVKGDTEVKAGQKVVVFCQKTAVKKLQDMFTR